MAGLLVPAPYDDAQLVYTGEFGQILTARDPRTLRRVLVQKPRHPFQSRGADDGRGIFREIKLLRLIQHRNIIRLEDLQVLATPTGRELAIVLEAMPYTLAQAMRAIAEAHVMSIVHQILSAVQKLHSLGIVHRGLDPDTIGIDPSGHVKVLSLTGSRYMGEAARTLTQSKVPAAGCYQSPELLLQMPYDARTDIWSVGCIFGELLARQPVFEPTFAYGTLPPAWAALGPLPDPLRAKLIEYTLLNPDGSFIAGPVAGAWQRVPDLDAIAQGLLSQLLRVDPAARLSADAALRHEYLEPMHDDKLRAIIEAMEVAENKAHDCPYFACQIEDEARLVAREKLAQEQLLELAEFSLDELTP
eukprot:m.8470 g.8470  ORF g.8470 m.8470 type:complete len:359 (+) comp2286_c0_seq2:67-1143(+)